jgi:hypothetical protein
VRWVASRANKLGLLFDPEDGGDVFLRNVDNELHDVINKKIGLAITTAVRTSNPTELCVF